MGGVIYLFKENIIENIIMMFRATRKILQPWNRSKMLFKIKKRIFKEQEGIPVTIEAKILIEWKKKLSKSPQM